MPTQARQALDQLIATETDPLALRRRWAETMMGVFEASMASVYGFVVDDDGTPRICDVQFIGTEAFEEHGRASEGLALLELDVEAEHLADLDRGTVVQRSELPAVFVESLWDPHGLISAVNYGGVEGGRIVGDFNVFRTVDGAGPFTGADLQGSARAWGRQTYRMLSVTDAMLLRQRGAPAARRVFLCRPDGAVRLGDDGEPWGTAEQQASVRQAVGRFWGTEQLDAEAFMGPLRLRFSRLAGADDEGVLVRIDAMVRPRLPRFLELTRTQVAVASQAARGSTVGEIARELHRSPETVKSHLKAVYTHLGIGSRAELRHFYDRVLDWAPAA